MARTSALSLSIQERSPLSVTVARRLREAIVSGQFPLDAEIPSEKDLCSQLGVGRSTVREALRILQAQGLLSGGDTVSTARPRVSLEHTLASAAHTMENALRLGRVPLSDLVALRVVIEGTIAAAAAEASDRADFSGARAAIAVMKQRGIDVDTFREADLQFHRELAALAGNSAFTMIMGVLRSAISAHLGEALHHVRDRARTIAALTREHEAILAAVERGNATRARALITKHILEFYAEGS